MPSKRIVQTLDTIEASIPVPGGIARTLLALTGLVVGLVAPFVLAVTALGLSPEMVGWVGLPLNLAIGALGLWVIYRAGPVRLLLNLSGVRIGRRFLPWDRVYYAIVQPDGPNFTLWVQPVDKRGLRLGVRGLTFKEASLLRNRILAFQDREREQGEPVSEGDLARAQELVGRGAKARRREAAGKVPS